MRAKSLFTVLCAMALVAGCGDPPPSSNGSGNGGDGNGNATENGGGKTGTPGNPIAGVGYNPEHDPLVNPPTMLEPMPDDLSEIEQNETFIATLDGNPATMNPIFSSSAYESRLNDLLFTGPFTFNAKMQFMLNEDLVESLDTSEDRKVWTLKLKPGHTWQDGHPFTAHDIVFSWGEILDDRVPCPAQKAGTDQVIKCVALDDLTVEYTVKQPSPTSCWDIYFSIIPKHLYEKEKENDPTLKASEYYAKLNRNPVGSGPYRLVEWKENDSIILERWDDYKGAAPKFKRIIFRIIPDRNIQLLTFESGDTDETRINSKQFADDTVRSEKFKKVGFKAKADQWSFSYIVWNQDGSNPFFNDVRTRTAMTHACNIALMLETISYNLPTPCYGPFHPDAPHFNKTVKLLKYDLDKASALLDDVGWKISDEDGWRYKDGQKFSFTFLYSQGSSAAEQIAAIMGEDLKSIGVDMKTEVMEWATFSEKTRKHDFQAATAAWGTGVDPDTNWNIWHTEAYTKGRNYGGFSNERVDELFVKARSTFDNDARMDCYREIHKHIYDDQAYTFLWNMPVLWVFNNRVRGINYSPRGVWGFDPSINEWWVKKGEGMRAMK